jgi:hypothetical protein
MKKELSEMVFPVENYTDKIHTGVKATMANYSHLSFTLHQLRPYLQAGYPWLKNLTERQATLLDQIIKTGLAKLIQIGMVKKVTSKVSVESQWQWASKVAESGYTNITSEDDVAQTDEAKKAVNRRAVGGRSLWKLNGKAKLGLLH